MAKGVNTQKLALTTKMLLIHEFRDKHLSGNFARSIRIANISNNSSVVHIAPRTYDIALYIRDKKLVFKGGWSYADKLNREGSIIRVYTQKGRKTIKIGNHKGYISDTLIKVISKQNKALKGAEIKEWNIQY